MSCQPLVYLFIKLLFDVFSLTVKGLGKMKFSSNRMVSYELRICINYMLFIVVFGPHLKYLLNSSLYCPWIDPTFISDA